MKNLIAALVMIALITPSIAQEAEEATTDSTALFMAIYQDYLDSMESTFQYQHGIIEIGNDLATLSVPNGYKFLDAEQTNVVLTEIWGNPPSETLGMLLPEDISPVSINFTYAVEITYDEEGYIEDDDAKDLDYDDLLETMQQDTRDANPSRIDQGYEAVELVGWASSPYYDASTKKLHWAKELKFGDSEINTLNYNIRILGRKGYLNMNAIGDIDVLPAFNQDIDKVLASVEFNEGNRYEDFDPEIDKIAAYGIGGLIAGKVLAKVGFFALIAKFWKVIAIAVAGGFTAFRKKFFGKGNEA